ncbi:MAG: beta strand repeat-containing protein, partial [Gemmatimonadaceae bacterium]
MHSVSRSLLVAGIVALGGLTACGDKIEIPVAPTPGPAAKDSSVREVNVTPSTAQIQVGGTQTFIANVIGGPDLTNRNVTWSSSNTAIADISAAGVATGKAAGQTTIIATSSANGSVKGAAVLTVAAVTPASLSFFGVNNQAGGPATLNNAAGQLNIIANVDPGQSGLRSVQLIGVGCRTGAAGDTAVIATAPISGSTGSQTQQQVTLAFPTAAFNTTTGATTYTNGNCQLAIRGLDAAGNIIAGTLASGPAVTLNNANSVYGTIIATKAAADAAGLNWNDGDVTVQAFPVIYSRGTTISASTPGSVTLTVAGAGAVAPVNATKALTAGANGGFTATFTEATDLAGAQGNPMGANVTLVDNTGNTFGGGAQAVSTQASVAAGAPVAASIRYDNVAPLAVTAYNTAPTAGSFIGSAATLPTALTATNFGGAAAAAADNNGVDKVTVQLQYGLLTSTGVVPAAAAANWTTFTSASQLPATSNATGPGAVVVRVQTCDALGNCSTYTPAAGSAFGVDLAAPVATVTATPSNGTAQAAPATLTVTAQDPQNANGTNGSGFTGTPLQVTATVTNGAGANQCINASTGAPVALVNGVCPATAQSSSFTLPATNGIYTITYYLVDQAGNQTTPVTVTYTVDNVAPTVFGPIVPPTSVAQNSAISAPAQDNIAVIGAQGSLDYTTTAGLSFAEPGTANPTVGNAITMNQNSTVTTTLANFY